jgi:hypothetical protein
MSNAVRAVVDAVSEDFKELADMVSGKAEQVGAA